MDLICPRCGEPMEFDTLHEEARVRQEQATEDNVIRSYDSVFSEVSSEWRSIGCNALHNIGASCTPAPEGSAMGNRALMASAAYEALGDDLDGRSVNAGGLRAMKVAGFLIVLFLLYSGRAFIIALRHIGTSPAVAVLLTIAVVLAASRLGRRT